MLSDDSSSWRIHTVTNLFIASIFYRRILWTLAQRSLSINKTSQGRELMPFNLRLWLLHYKFYFIMRGKIYGVFEHIFAPLNFPLLWTKLAFFELSFGKNAAKLRLSSLLCDVDFELDQDSNKEDVSKTLQKFITRNVELPFCFQFEDWN